MQLIHVIIIPHLSAFSISVILDPHGIGGISIRFSLYSFSSISLHIYGVSPLVSLTTDIHTRLYLLRDKTNAHLDLRDSSRGVISWT